MTLTLCDGLVVEDGWTFTFAFSDEVHCFGEPLRGLREFLDNEGLYAKVVAHLPHSAHNQDGAGVAPAVAWDDMRDAVEATLRELHGTAGKNAPVLNVAHAQNLDEFRLARRPHTGCECAVVAWNNWANNAINTLLKAPMSGGREWLVYLWDDVARVRVWREPTIDLFWEALNSVDWWERMELVWDETSSTLNMKFWSYPSLWWGKAVLLTTEQAHVTDSLDTLGIAEVHEIADRVLLHGMLVAEIVLALWGDDGNDPTTLCGKHNCETITAMDDVAAQVAAANLDPEAVTAARLLLGTGFSGTIEDLLETARTVAADTAHE